MKSNYFRFQVDELIKTYKQKIREQKFKDDQDMDTANKALYETVLFEINGAERYVDEKKRTYPMIRAIPSQRCGRRNALTSRCDVKFKDMAVRALERSFIPTMT